MTGAARSPASPSQAVGTASPILIIDNDSNAAGRLRVRLENEGHSVVVAATPEQGLALARNAAPKLILLDPAVAPAGRLELCADIRAETEAPVIVLSTSNDEGDKIVALELGADDYVTKPYQIGELIARIRALLRRSRSPTPPRPRTLTVDDLRIDLSQRAVTRGRRPIQLRPREYELLVFLIENRGRTFSRAQLLSRIWGYHGQTSTRTVDVHIERLRQKIEHKPSAPKLIVTVRGIGYQFNA